MDPDPDHIAGCNRRQIDAFQRFVNETWIAPLGPGRRGQHVEPARRDHGDAERYVTRIDQMNSRGLSHLDECVTYNRRRNSRLHHLALRYFNLRNDRLLVVAVDPGSATARQLDRSERGEHDELKGRILR